MKKLFVLTLLLALSTQAHAGLWDTITSWFGEEDTQTAPEATQPAANTTTAMVQQGLALLPFVMEQLGVSQTQASGGVGALLQAATALLSQGEGQSLLAAIPNAQKLMAAAPNVAGDSATGSMMSDALKAAGDYSKSAKAASQLTSQFEALGMGADKIPDFSKTTQNFLKQTDNDQAADLLSSALSSLF